MTVDWNDRCEWVGCTNEYETAVQIGEYGLTFDFCADHAEQRVAATDEARYYDDQP